MGTERRDVCGQGGRSRYRGRFARDGRTPTSGLLLVISVACDLLGFGHHYVQNLSRATVSFQAKRLFRLQYLRRPVHILLVVRVHTHQDASLLDRMERQLPAFSHVQSRLAADEAADDTTKNSTADHRDPDSRSQWLLAGRGKRHAADEKAGEAAARHAGYRSASSAP